MDGVNARIAVLQFNSAARRLGLGSVRLDEIEARAAAVGTRRVWQALGRAERLAERVECGLEVPRISSVFEAGTFPSVTAGAVTAADGNASPVRTVQISSGDLNRIAQRKRRDGIERGGW